MQFDVRDVVPWSRSTVFETHRDQLQGIAAYIESVERVDQRSRTRDAGGRVEQIHDWHGRTSVLPAMIRSFVPTEMLQWRETTVWCPHTWTATWTIATGLGPAVEAHGKNAYIEIDGRCAIEIEGAFGFHPDKVPQLAAVPASAAPMIEQFVVKLIVPMIKQSGEAVSAYLDAQGVKRTA